MTYQQFLESFGQKNAGILARWLGPGASPERIRAIGDAKEAEYRRLAREHGLTPLPGAAAWLGACTPRAGSRRSPRRRRVRTSA